MMGNYGGLIFGVGLLVEAASGAYSRKKQIWLNPQNCHKPIKLR